MTSKHIQKRRGLATIVTSAIMMSAVCILGSAGVVWSQTSLSTQQIEMSKTVDDYTNKLNESATFEYVYCSDSPCNTIIVIITNNGKIGIDIEKITISEKNSGFSKIHSISEGEIRPNSSIVVPINDPSFSSFSVLDIQSSTERGNIIQTQIST
ncbi:hypothetical protein [Nitrosopumilus sp.]|uniref:hypothetical protein n=1 Tax=Nitrosopumilus sp. TaxID=2024843 RepID=UPI00247D5E07|nr:hypothetical protein [Nitrosopumilus sp.]MCV0430034.1 hypothetical protein [Nitrosopumilus sp.]